MARKAPTSEVIRALFALSGNRCAFPGCEQALISSKGNFIAQLCHIEAANEGGERYNKNQTDNERRDISNLLLLCYPHHIETNNIKEYPVEVLQKIKRDHEKQHNDKFELPFESISRVIDSIELELDKLFALAQDTNKTVHDLKDILVSSLGQSRFNLDSYHISQLETIKSLRKQGKLNTVIELLLKFKKDKLDTINSGNPIKSLG